MPRVQIHRKEIDVPPAFPGAVAADARAHPYRYAFKVVEVGGLFVPVAGEYELYKAGAEVVVAGGELAWDVTHTQ